MDDGAQVTGGARQRGFTLLELLVVVAIIGIIAAIMIPAYNHILTKSRKNALAADGRTLFQAFLQYQLDQDAYPPCCTPPEEAFDKTSLWPLTRYEYLNGAEGILGKLQGNQVTDYDSPDLPFTNADFYAVLTSARDTRIQVLIADTDQYPPNDGVSLYGIYFIETDGTLTPVGDR